MTQKLDDSKSSQFGLCCSALHVHVVHDHSWTGDTRTRQESKFSKTTLLGSRGGHHCKWKACNAVFHHQLRSFGHYVL